MATELYLVHAWEDIEPLVVGPFPTEEARVAEARGRRAERQWDGLYRLDVVDGKPVMETFSGGELDPLDHEAPAARG